MGPTHGSLLPAARPGCRSCPAASLAQPLTCAGPQNLQPAQRRDLPDLAPLSSRRPDALGQRRCTPTPPPRHPTARTAPRDSRKLCCVARPCPGTRPHLEQVGVAQAALDVLAHALVALAGESVPHVDGGVPVAGAHDGGIPGVKVLHIGGQALDVARARDDHPARHRGPDELVACIWGFEIWGLGYAGWGCLCVMSWPSGAVTAGGVLTTPGLGASLGPALRGEALCEGLMAASHSTRGPDACGICEGAEFSSRVIFSSKADTRAGLR